MKKKMLLHACCAPCTTSVEERLRDEYDLDIFWYNPNIYPDYEHEKRLSEMRRFASYVRKDLIIADQNREDIYNWEAAVVEYQNQPEGRQRCSECILFRLSKAVETAAKEKYDIVATTLTVTPRKSPIIVNKVGNQLSEKFGISFLNADFKKQDGYLRSIQISKELDLYRQNYCGCRFSERCPISS